MNEKIKNNEVKKRAKTPKRLSGGGQSPQRNKNPVMDFYRRQLLPLWHQLLSRSDGKANRLKGTLKTPSRFLNRSDGKANQLTETLNWLSPILLQYVQLLLKRLKPLWDYYQLRSRREQILILIASAFLGVLFVWSAIISPYINFRQSLHTAYQEARIEYGWLEQQMPRLESLLQKRGAQRNALADPTEFIKGKLPKADVSANNDGEYSITWTGSQGKEFFAMVNSLMGAGASLSSISFDRPDSKKEEAIFSATIKY